MMTMYTTVNGNKHAIITSAFEHHAVLNPCQALERSGYPVAYMWPSREGYITAEILKEYITGQTHLTSVMFANNEIGTVEPIKSLAEAAHKNGCVFHTDAVQAVGHISVDVNHLGVDMLSASAHKFNGPKGIGFLYVRSGIKLEPLINGGGQENGMRARTENVASIVGMEVALKEHIDNLESEMTYLFGLSQQFVEDLRKYGLDFILNGSPQRIPGSISVSFQNADGEMLLHRLDLMGTAVGTGSACDSKKQCSLMLSAQSDPQASMHMEP